MVDESCWEHGEVMLRPFVRHQQQFDVPGKRGELLFA
jgi:hypothetical protein